MRVSTLGSYERGLSAMQQLQSALDRTQRQISSGKRILTPSDDPISSSRALELREKLARLEQFDRNSNIAENRLQNEESALSSVNNLLQRVRELALQANNSTQSNESRQLIATEMRQRLDELVDIANAKDGSGRFLFAGNLDSTTPVSVVGNGYAYNGDQGRREIQIGESRRIADGDSGDDVFFRVRAGNGSFTTTAAPGNTGSAVIGQSSVTDTTQYDNAPYSVQFSSATDYEVRDGANVLIASGTYQSGSSIAFRGIEFTLDGAPAAGDSIAVAPSPYKSVFAGVQQMIAAVETVVVNDTTRAVLNNGINTGLQDIDQGIGNILDVQTRIGSRLAAIESQVDSNGAFALTVQDTLGSLEDLDYAEALSRLSLEATTLEAAQKSFVATQRLSLFAYI
jgi:flagellar hook-associated protein 3 FlgL